MVSVEKNENGHDRGLHVVIISPKNGEVEQARSFDTYVSSEELEDALLDIPNGYIIAVACKDECSTNLSHSVR